MGRTVGRKIGQTQAWSAVFMMFACSVLGACNADPSASAGTVQKSSHSTVEEPEEAPLVTLMLPAGGDVRDFGLVAHGSLELQDRARVRDQQGAPLHVHNVGSVQVGPSTTIGTWDNSAGFATGNVTSHGSVLLRDRAKLGGNVITAGTIQKQNQVVVAGTQQAGAQLASPLVLSFPQPIETDLTRPPVVLPVDSTQILEPGAYSQVTAYARSTLVLKSGNYALSGLQIEPQSKVQLQVDPAKGPVVLYVDNVLAWRDTTLPGATDALLLIYKGTQNIKFEQKLSMAVLAPDAKVTLATGGLTHTGSIYAKGISLDPDVRFDYVPFKYWDWVLPPRPIAECVYPAGAGTYMAVFGYENGRGVDITVPASTTNFFSPPSTRQISVLSTFKPGRHEKVVWVDMPSTGVTWTVNGQSTKVDLTSPACPLSEMVIPHEGPVTDRGFPPLTGPRAIPWKDVGGGVLPANFPLPGAGGVILAKAGGSTTVLSEDHRIAGTGDAEPPTLDLPTSGARPGSLLSLTMTGFAEREGLWENARIELGATIGGMTFPMVEVDHDRNGDAEGSRTVEAQIFGSDVLKVRFAEIDNLSGDDILKFEGQFLYDENRIVGETTKDFSGRSPDVEVLDRPIADEIEISGSGANNRLNRLRFKLRRVEPEDPDRKVKICAYWPTAYWDNGQESYPGQEIEGSDLRAIPASFAKYWLTIISGFEETHPVLPASGSETEGAPHEYRYLDKDGCIPDHEAVRVAQLAHFPGQDTSPTGRGIDLYMTIIADYAIPSVTPGEYARFFVYYPGWVDKDAAGNAIFPPKQVASGFFHYVDFTADVGTDPLTSWTVNADGLMIPPERLNLIGAETSFDGLNAAAAIGQMLSRLTEEGVVLPSGNYPVEVGASGSVTASSAPDYACRRVGDSFFSGDATEYKVPGIEIGPSFFPCAYAIEGGMPVDPTTNYCTACADDSECTDALHTGDCILGACQVDVSLLNPGNDCRQACGPGLGECPGGQSCQLAVPRSGTSDRVGGACDGSGPCYCAWAPQGASKTTVSHESGHLFQHLTMGSLQIGGYSYACPANTSPTTMTDRENCALFGEVSLDASGNPYLLDPPGTAPVCACGHTAAASGAHCIQSIESTPSAQAEGFGQFFAALVWNNPADSCWFNYYKEVLMPDNSYQVPPVSINCNTRTAWRDVNMCNVFDPAFGPPNPSKMSTELDWMNFLTELEKTVGLNDVMNIYRRACHPENVSEQPPCLKAGQVDPATGLVLTEDQDVFADGCYKEGMRCDDKMSVSIQTNPGVIQTSNLGGRPIFWRDGLTTDPRYPPEYHSEGGFYDGAVRIWGGEPDSPARVVATLGDLHAVSDGSDP